MSETDSLPELPENWAWSTLGEVCSDPQYGWTTSASDKGKLRLLRTTDITSGKIDWDTVPFCQEEPPNKEKYVLHDGDVVISRAGSVGYSYLLTSPEEAVFASYLIRFRPYINKRFFSHFLQSPHYWNAISEKSIGIAVPNVNASKLKGVTVPIPPLPEQQRIVAKIEELFTKLDAGADALRKARAQLGRYRQAILKAAVTGELTREWREAHRGELKPSADLLTRILKNRRSKWEAEQLAKMQAAGKPPKNDNWKQKYQEPVVPNTNGLPDLPDGWTWVSIDQISELVTKGSSPNWQGFEYTSEGITFVRSQNVLWGRLDLSEIAHLPASFNEKEKKSILKVDDVLLNIVGASIGRAALVTNEIEGGNTNQAVAIVRLLVEEFTPKLLVLVFLSPDIQRRIHLEKVDVARANLSLEDVKNLQVPLMSIVEQQQIVSEVERLFSITDAMEHTIEQSLKQAERLRQSILQQAFVGKLVPQDPNDEPASCLLERIREERANKSTAAPKQKRKSSKHEQAGQITFFT